MPLYSYECENCGRIFDLHIPLKDHVQQTVCEICDGDAKQIIMPGHGGIQEDSPKWLDNSVRMALQDLTDPSVKPIETRGEWKKHLKDNRIIAAG